MGQVSAAISGQMQVSGVSQLSSAGATGSGPTRSLQFTSVGLSTIVNANGANIDGTILVQGNSIPGTTVRLTGPAPYPVNLSVLIAAQAQGGLPALTASPNAVTIAAGQTASNSFTLAASTGSVGAMNVEATYHALQVTARVTVTKSKDKEVVKDNKDRKDVTPDKVTIEKITVEKVQPIEILPKVTEEVAGSPEPTGQAFVTSSQRPAVGGAAFGAIGGGEQP
jgi:hypothetical protein